MDESLSAVNATARQGGVVLGAPDFLDRDRQLEIALQQMLTLHNEVGRMIKASSEALDQAYSMHAAADRLTRHVLDDRRGVRGRLRTVWGRLRARNVGVVGFVRTSFWIIFKSRAADATERAELARAVQGMLRASRAGAPTSPWAGDRPVRDLMSAGRLDEAHVVARALLEGHGSNRRFVALMRDLEVRRGSLSAVLALNRRLQKLEKVNEAALRVVEGRLREISGWTPMIAGPLVPVEAVDERTVMHLVKESRPYLSNGFTSRSHRNFLAERDAGLRPVVVTEPGFPRSSGVSEFEAVEFVDGIEHRRLDVWPGGTQGGPPDQWLREFARLAYSELREIRPAVLHVSSGRRGYETALVGVALKHKTGVPLVYEVRSFFEGLWTPDLRHEETGEIYLRRMATEHLCMTEADLVLTLGDAMRDEIISRGIEPSKVMIIPNGVEAAEFTPRKRPRRLAAELGIGRLQTFGYVSNMDHARESQETLVRAAAILKSAGRDFRCVLVGGGGRLDAIRALAAQLGVAEEVIFTGPVDHHETPDHYALIDVFVVPRIEERAARYVTPLKPFEAMGLGIPVVASDLPALREIVDPPARGVVFPPGDHRALAECVADLFDSPRQRARLGKMGREWVVGERSWAANGARYEHAYKEAMMRASAAVTS